MRRKRLCEEDKEEGLSKRVRKVKELEDGQGTELQELLVGFFETDWLL